MKHGDTSGTSHMTARDYLRAHHLHCVSVSQMSLVENSPDP